MLTAQAAEYQRLWDNLQQLRAPDPAVCLEHLLRCGDPAREIVRIAHQLRCGLIVMGTHSRTRLRRLLMGSVAGEVVREAPCAVLTVEAPLGRWGRRFGPVQQLQVQG
jgi:nucleotide-binding universal stress UspA family protein